MKGFSTHTTDLSHFAAMRDPLRRWSSTVLHFRHEREGALSRLEGYAPIDNDEVAEELWSTRYDGSDTDKEYEGSEDDGRLPKFLPWVERLRSYQADGKLPLSEE